MNVIRVFPARNKWTPDDALAFVGEPPLFRPGTRETPVMVSATFTWQRRRAEQIAEAWRGFYRNVQVGGPAYDDPGGEFTPGMFLKAGCTITSRGCPKKCHFCKVWRVSGAVRELPIKPGWIVQDDNLLATTEKHLRTVFEMLRAQERRIYFNGGLDKHFLRPWHAELFASIRIGELWFACDGLPNDLKYLAQVKEILPFVPMRKMRCYTMIGDDAMGESIQEAERRIESVFEMGFLPFSQLYQPTDPAVPQRVYSDDWKKLNRKWCRPAAYLSEHRSQVTGQRPQEKRNGHGLQETVEQDVQSRGGRRANGEGGENFVQGTPVCAAVDSVHGDLHGDAGGLQSPELDHALVDAVGSGARGEDSVHADVGEP